MKDKIDEITYNLELGCINWQEASKQLFALCDVVSSCADKEKQAYDDGYECGCTTTANDLGARF